MESERPMFDAVVHYECGVHDNKFSVLEKNKENRYSKRSSSAELYLLL